MPKLTLMVERTALKVYDIDPVEHPIIRVGREMGLEVVIDNVAVSRHQAELRLQDDQWFVRDLGSGNGTFLNGRRLSGMAPIKRGDEISVGKISLFFDHVPTEPAPLLYVPRTGYAEPGRTLVMRPEELARLRATVVEKRRAHLRWKALTGSRTARSSSGEARAAICASAAAVPSTTCTSAASDRSTRCATRPGGIACA
jgi:pSer/pThr/pTyr-binding forkhead associated (FHA) protein